MTRPITGEKLRLVDMGIGLQLACIHGDGSSGAGYTRNVAQGSLQGLGQLTGVICRVIAPATVFGCIFEHFISFSTMFERT